MQQMQADSAAGALLSSCPASNISSGTLSQLVNASCSIFCRIILASKFDKIDFVHVAGEGLFLLGNISPAYFPIEELVNSHDPCETCTDEIRDNHVITLGSTSLSCC